MSLFIKNHHKEFKIFGIAIGFRIIIYIFSVVIMAMMGEYESGILFSDFLETWKRWDSTPYINIAQNTYIRAIENGEHLFLVFYPLYPWLIRLFSVFIEDFRLCGILISTLSYAIGCIFFYKITEKEFGDKAAENAVLLLAVFPFAFFFGSIATESLFFAVISAFFYYLRKHKWYLVAILGALACMTKVQGLLLTFSVLAELFFFKRGFYLLKQKKWKEFLKRIILPGGISALMLGGFVVYLYINYYVEGDPFKFLFYQKNHWGNSLCPMWNTLEYIIHYAVHDWHLSIGMSLWVPELLLFIVFIVFIIYGFKRIRSMYLIYLIMFFLLTYSSTWLISGGRYTLSALPIFMLLGNWVSKHERLKTPVAVCSAMLMAIYMVGFYSWKQIM